MSRIVAYLIKGEVNCLNCAPKKLKGMTPLYNELLYCENCDEPVLEALGEESGMNKRHAVTQDEGMNPALKAQVQDLRGGMKAAMERKPIPERFVTEPDPDSPAMWITDTLTGKKTCVGLCDYLGARQVLRELFGDAE